MYADSYHWNFTVPTNEAASLMTCSILENEQQQKHTHELIKGTKERRKRSGNCSFKYWRNLHIAYSRFSCDFFEIWHYVKDERIWWSFLLKFLMKSQKKKWIDKLILTIEWHLNTVKRLNFKMIDNDRNRF